jgi:trk system potassium uptake protein TrkH
VSLYILCVVVLTLIVSGIEEDLVTAVSVVYSSMNNLGPALGQAGSHYGELADATKWLMSFAMLLGRLEIFTILVLLTPTYWKH